MTFDIADFHERAVRTPSHESVEEMRTLLVDSLSSGGCEPVVTDDGCVLASRGAGEPHYVLNTHIDTVPPHVPYQRDGDVVRGRGACDAKGPLAALLAAFFRTDPEQGRVTIAITPDEETTQAAAPGLAERLDADGYIVGEPTDLDVCVAARGQFEGEIRIEGKSGHASDPSDGANAIVGAGPLLEVMTGFDDANGTPEHELLGAPTLTPTLISGGEAANQIPGECRITFDRRSVPPETTAEFFDAIEASLREHLPAEFGLDVGLARPDGAHPEPFATDPEEQLVKVLADASGGDVRPFGAATEASYFGADTPTVVFGPGVLADEEGAVAHSDREYVHLSDVRAAADAVEGTLDSLLG